MTNSHGRDPARALLTRLMWRWAMIAALLITLFAIGEWFTPRIASGPVPGWVITSWMYMVKFALGFGVGFALLALMTLHQRSELD